MKSFEIVVSGRVIDSLVGATMVQHFSVQCILVSLQVSLSSGCVGPQLVGVPGNFYHLPPFVNGPGLWFSSSRWPNLTNTPHGTAVTLIIQNLMF